MKLHLCTSSDSDKKTLDYDEYMQMSVKELRAICKDLNINNYSKKNKDDTIQLILNHWIANKSINPADRIYKALFSSWFVVPYKPTAAMSEGTANEKKVLKGIASFLASISPFSLLLQCQR